MNVSGRCSTYDGFMFLYWEKFEISKTFLFESKMDKKFSYETDLFKWA